ncbi:unnamed protein product (macronuclear) [Paramecium tetraurelia]|uniref:Uncharacterized protein n=1 Tax=Paramecium tetraurelia TaxID=5888 RepID=A0BYZ5_PARTE|nr:uncharacterized protein GSPATT00033615001 [Paramecium tetraurelia]CAK63762.1 unnamed protein product [Paramecium tetraurelia]
MSLGVPLKIMHEACSSYSYSRTQNRRDVHWIHGRGRGHNECPIG